MVEEDIVNSSTCINNNPILRTLRHNKYSKKDKECIEDNGIQHVHLALAQQTNVTVKTALFSLMELIALIKDLKAIGLAAYKKYSNVHAIHIIKVSGTIKEQTFVVIHVLMKVTKAIGIVVEMKCGTQSIVMVNLMIQTLIE